MAKICLKKIARSRPNITGLTLQLTCRFTERTFFHVFSLKLGPAFAGLFFVAD